MTPSQSFDRAQGGSEEAGWVSESAQQLLFMWAKGRLRSYLKGSYLATSNSIV